MRTLLLLRGAAGCGKSTWIEQQGLKPYAISADDIRLLCQSPILQTDGSLGITPKNDKSVWKLLFQILEMRMTHGDFVVIDATNSKTSEINQYKNLCDKYGYRIYCVDFTDIPIDEVKRRNANRMPREKRVPDAAIDKMYARFKTQKIPAGITVIKPDEVDRIFFKPIDLSNYKKIHHIGDIHGCNTVLQQYFESCGGLKDDEFYIFCGDYLDRGIENVDVLNFLFSIIQKPNVLLLEGNHEKWLRCYGFDEPIKSQEFEAKTKVQLVNAGITKKDIRKFYRRLAQCAYYTYHGNTYLVTHGGLSNIPINLLFIATEQMIAGVGSYKDTEYADKSFEQNTPENYYQIHGHRNLENNPIQINDHTFNLEGKVEYGGMLRCLQITPDDYYCIETENPVFRILETSNNVKLSDISTEKLIEQLRNNSYIQEKAYGNISSFNFTHNAFFDKVWNEQTIKARGLFLDTSKNKVVARSYNKFFNINERTETKLDMLQLTLQFPVMAYVKENGFLGIVSYDEYNDDLFIASKSTPTGPFAGYLRNMIYKKVSPENREKMKLYMKEHDVSFTFECVDMTNDPHIIEYPEDRLYLLNIVRNNIEYDAYTYEDICQIANDFGLTVKEKAYEIANWKEFVEWYYDVTADDYLYNGRHIEGFVIEDNVGYMVKVKLAYYKFWKTMRNVAQKVAKYGQIVHTENLYDKTSNEFYGWLKNLYAMKDPETIPTDICSLRKMFYQDLC